MKVEFFFNKHPYLCTITSHNNRQELRIRNERGEILAVQQGQKQGLIGKSRKNSRTVDVSGSYYFNLIKTALNAWQIEELKQELNAQQEVLAETQNILHQKNKQVDILTQKIAVLDRENQKISQTGKVQLESLEEELKVRELKIEVEREKCLQLERKLENIPKSVNQEESIRKVQDKIGDRAWSNLTRFSQKKLCDSYIRYHSILNSFTVLQDDYSEAGLGLCLVAERELLDPFFKNIYRFLVREYPELENEYRAFEIGGVTIKKQRGKYTLGHLPVLLSLQWDTFKKDALAQSDRPRDEGMYHTVFFGNCVSDSDRQIVRKFLQQWEHPLATWMRSAEKAASAIDQIRQLRNRIPHHEDILYRWQFERFWCLLLGGRTKKGILEEIFS
ncbi:MAG: hypothetical protein AAGA60_11490 [Cyanobacteria bacterium P01_E01_bin.42]